MGICIGIGNYIGKSTKVGINKDPNNEYYNIITEQETNILTENYRLILRDIINNLASESSLILITEDNKIILLE